MNVLVGGVGVRLETQDEPLHVAWRQLFAGWPQTAVSTPAITFNLQLVERLTSSPTDTLLYTDVGVRPAGDEILSVFRDGAASIQLHFFDGGLVCVPLAKAGLVSGQVTREALGNGRFEDIIFTSLAPMLRRRGIFAVHAFAAVRTETAVLLVGPSHSGKTTTGLNLLLNGWQLLANDVVLLQATDDGVFALPTPGEISIRPPTYTLLPKLKRNQSFDWGQASQVKTILFPKIKGEVNGKTAVLPLPRAIALAQLMGESVDRWDEEMLNHHTAMLHQLTSQCNTFQLLLDQDINNISDIIADTLRL